MKMNSEKSKRIAQKKEKGIAKICHLTKNVFKTLKRRFQLESMTNEKIVLQENNEFFAESIL